MSSSRAPWQFSPSPYSPPRRQEAQQQTQQQQQQQPAATQAQQQQANPSDSQPSAPTSSSALTYTHDAMHQLLSALSSEKSRNVDLVRQNLTLQSANASLLTEMDAATKYTRRLKSEIGERDARAEKYRIRAEQYRDRAHRAEAELIELRTSAESRRLQVLGMFDALRSQFVEVLSNWSCHITSLAESEQSKVSQLAAMKEKLAEHARQIGEAKEKLQRIHEPQEAEQQASQQSTQQQQQSRPDAREEETANVLKAAYARLEGLSAPSSSATAAAPSTSLPSSSSYSSLNHPSAHSSSPRARVGVMREQAEYEARGGEERRGRERERREEEQLPVCSCSCTCSCALLHLRSSSPSFLYSAVRPRPHSSKERERAVSFAEGRGREVGRKKGASDTRSRSSSRPRSVSRPRSLSRPPPRPRSCSAPRYPEFLTRAHGSYLHTKNSAAKIVQPGGSAVPLPSSYPERPCSGVQGRDRPSSAGELKGGVGGGGKEWTKGRNHTSVQTHSTVKPIYSYSSHGDLLISNLSSSLKAPVSSEWRFQAVKGRKKSKEREPSTPPQQSHKAVYAKIAGIQTAGVKTKY
jgi:hypothetical protein